MKVKLLKPTVTSLVIILTIGILSSCTHKKDWGNPTLIFKADFSTSNTTKLSFNTYNPVDSINWGDGITTNRKESIVLSNKYENLHIYRATHNYEVNKKYIIRIYGPTAIHHEFNFLNKTKYPKVELVSITDSKSNSISFHGDLITKIDHAFLKGVPELTSARYMFFGCPNIKIIPHNLLMYNTKLTNGEYMFQNCISIKTVPTDLLKYNIKLTSTCGMFTDCEGLETIPTDLLRHNTKIADASYMFAGCEDLKIIPTDLLKNNTELINASSMFAGCEDLKTIPINLLKYNIRLTSASMMFRYCNGFKIIPSNLLKYNTHLADATEMFSSCTGLKTIPSDLIKLIPNINNVQGIFYKCTQFNSSQDIFKSIPELIRNKLFKKYY